MFPRIRSVDVIEQYKILVTFDSGDTVVYDVEEDINTISDFLPLKTEKGLFDNFIVDSSRTCISWSDRIDLPSDTILEYGIKTVA